MRATRYRRGNEFEGDMAYYRACHSSSSDRRKLFAALRGALDEELTEKQRRLVQMYYFEDLNIPQIAEKLGVNRSTVSRSLRRAEANLHRFLRYVR